MMLAQHVAQVLTCMAAESDHRAEVRNIKKNMDSSSLGYGVS